MKLTFIICLLMGFILTYSVFSQTTSTSPIPSPRVDHTNDKIIAKDKTSFWQIIKNGGVVMIPLGLISVLGMGLIFDGFARFSKKNTTPTPLVHSLENALSNGQ